MDHNPAYGGELTDDYIWLSLLSGFFAQRWDLFLNRDYFVPRSHAAQWQLTAELLEEWKQEAKQLGVPETLLRIPAHIEQMLADPEFYATARRAQWKRDMETGHYGSQPANAN